MPELPEVETVVRDLRPRLIGASITSVYSGKRPLRSPWKRPWGRLLIGRSVMNVQRRGKWIQVSLDLGGRLVFHLGMTGQLTVVSTQQERIPHTHLIFGLDGGERQLRFRDVRRFGGAKFFSNASALEKFFASAKLGPEPTELNIEYWIKRLATTRRCLKAVLLDQQVMAGVGNIYADESLFEACLHPMRVGCELHPNEAKRLRRAVATVLKRAIDRRGSSIRDYVDGAGKQGSYQSEFRVYQRTGEPCPRCQCPIEQIRLAGRSTHYCPNCQRRK